MRALPLVAPRLERGVVYRTEYQWQEQQCGRRGPGWLNLGVPCTGRQGCGCSDYHQLAHIMSEHMAESGIRPPHDGQVKPREGLATIRPYLPYITTANELFVAAAWQPFKVVFERGRVFYTNFGLLLWAKAKAAGKPAPWEATA